MSWLLLGAALAVEPEPPVATLIYYNARMALAEGEPLEATKLWLLRNALANQTGEVSPHDPDFHSVTWAALGELGVCQDGQPTDEDGAGLWPLALHNWVVANMGRKVRKQRPRPFDAFDVGRQQRFVSIGDVLGSRELGEVSLFRGACARQRLALFAAGESVTAKLSDRQVSARLLLYLLERSEETLAPQVRGRAAIDARRFDLYLQLAALAAREAREDAREQAREGRAVGLSRESVTAMNEEAPAYTWDADSEPARILRECLGWPIPEWMSLSPDRRRFIFQHARTSGGDRETLDGIALGIIDALTERGEGAEVETWIGLRTRDAAADPRAVWSGDRGQRLLALDPDHGFEERGVIALHRAVQQLEEGDLEGSLRSLAYALRHAQESRAVDEVGPLSRRWMSYVASQFTLDDELVATLRELLPPRDFSMILEDLLWGATFRADAASFERGVSGQMGRGALVRRTDLLRPLAQGDVGRFSAAMRAGLSTSPSETLRFIDQLLERLELEDADARAAQARTLVNLRAMLGPLSASDGATGRQARTVDELLDRTQAILEGVGAGAGTTPADRARALGPDGEVFVGSVRLAPSDPLPWPFDAVDAPAPAVFEPFDLVPEEWRDEGGELVFGWSIRG